MLCTKKYLPLTGIVFIAYLALSEGVYFVMFTVHGIKLCRSKNTHSSRSNGKPRAPSKRRQQDAARNRNEDQAAEVAEEGTKSELTCYKWFQCPKKKKKNWYDLPQDGGVA